MLRFFELSQKMADTILIKKKKKKKLSESMAFWSAKKSYNVNFEKMIFYEILIILLKCTFVPWLVTTLVNSYVNALAIFVCACDGNKLNVCECFFIG